jgi:photosystem II stability/assembly factor-like uncharacterized protein
MRRFRTAINTALAFATVPLLASAQAAPPAGAAVEPALFGGVRYRMIGPARGGRVTAVTGVIQEPHTFYFGSTGGGVWKTTDAGASWANVSDPFLDVGSIGALDVADSNPDIVWVGTGSEGLRSNVSIGRGIWKSADAGATWQFMGLRETGQIGAVIIHPSNPDIVLAAALGNPFRPNPERGVYRTRDGGRTWDRVLFLSDSTGFVDLEFHPGDPTTIYAAAWRAERKPWTIISGANEGGLYRSQDGGTTWTRMTAGLPSGLVGKPDFAVSPAAPDRVYALIEALPGAGLYRSDDRGGSWQFVSNWPGVLNRPFYYVNLDADPTNADVVFAGAEGFYRSGDGGRTFRTLRTPHGDNHDLWIHPRHPEIWIQANDGGVNVTLNGGRTWSTQYNQPTAEIYQVAVDNQHPYRIYGAQQDNSTLIMTSRPPATASPDDPIQLWRQGPGCETGPLMPHPVQPDTVYGSCKGQFSRMSLRTGQEKQYWVGGQSLYGNPGTALIFRFQRVTPMEISPHDPSIIYYGSQFVHRTRDEGVSWEVISPDLTEFDPTKQAVAGSPITIDVTGEEFYSTLYQIRESPLERGVIWTGANDGPIHMTRDGGATWRNVTPRGLPPGGRVQTIEPSPHRPGSAYVAVLRYLLGDFRPWIYRTDDYGTSWTLLTPGTNGLPADEPTRVVREDPDREGLLYAGTEFGMFISFDNGARWQSLQLNLPRTAVTDLRVHRQDLVVSTQGRSFWILDNLTALHQASPGVTASATHLFTPREDIRYRYSGGFGGVEGARPASADQPDYPPTGAQIEYWLDSTPNEPVVLEIRAADGTLVRRFSSAAPGEVAREPAEPGMRQPVQEISGTPRLPARQGVNRFTWDYRWPGPWTANPAASGRNGPLAVPGRYTVRLVTGGRRMDAPLVIHPDPRVAADGVTQGVFEDQLTHNLEVRDLVSEVNQLVEAVQGARRGATGAVAGGLAALEARLVTPPVRYSKPELQAHITYLYGMSMRADQQVSRDARERLAQLRGELAARTAEFVGLGGRRP